MHLLRLPIPALLLTLALAIAFPHPAKASSASCDDPVSAGTWRVEWTESDGNVQLVALDYRRRPDGDWIDASALTWELRWDNPPRQYVGLCSRSSCDESGVGCGAGEACLFGTCTTGACTIDRDCAPGAACAVLAPPFQPVAPRPAPNGALRPGLRAALDATVAGQPGLREQRIPARYSPRLVAPNGSCTVYLRPFDNGEESWRKAIVVGDSLAQSLNDAAYNLTHDAPQGYLQGQLNEHRLRAEIEGQGGRRWTAHPELREPLAIADDVLLDELRGLRAASDLRAIVVALGANDAGWVACGQRADSIECDPGSESDRLARLYQVIARLEDVFAELAGWQQCVVALTMPDHLAAYFGASPWHYAWAAQHINAWLRDKAAHHPAWLSVRDFAALSHAHHTWDAENWFADDDLHLNAAGKLIYTHEIVMAALSCP